MATYFISDTHFGNDRIMRKSRPEFQTTAEMDNAMIQNWIKAVADSDDVFILGDLFDQFTKNPVEILERLPGRKHLLLGNHDLEWLDCLTKIEKNYYFVEISSFHQMILGEYTLTLCHYPMLEWYASRKDPRSLMLHGHIHARKDITSHEIIRKHLSNILNCAPEINNYHPTTLEGVIRNNAVWYNRYE